METKELNLAEILKDCPVGTELYSVVFGPVKLIRVDLSALDKYPICLYQSEKDLKVWLTANGHIMHKDMGECILFPSKEQRDWNKFKVESPTNNNTNNAFKVNTLENFQNLKFLIPILECTPNACIAGGCFKQIFENKPIKDLDLFFTSTTHFADAREAFMSKGWTIKYENSKVIALEHKDYKFWIELIRSLYGPADFIISNFDFSITKFALYKNKEGDYLVTYSPDFFEHLYMKRLVIDGDLPFPISSWNRSYRYNRKYGYTLCRESKAKMLAALRNTTEEDNEQLGFYGGWD